MLEREFLAFESIYKEHQLVVRKFLYRYGGKDDLDEIVQEVFLKVFVGMESFDGRSSLKTWILRVALNTARNHYRSKGRKWGRVSFFSEILDAQEDRVTIEEAFINKESFEKAMCALSEKHREVMVLFSIEEFSIDEISEILKIPSGTVKSRISLAKAALKKFFV